MKRAVALNSNSALAHQNLGVVYFEAGRFKEATESLKIAVSLDPTSAAAHSALGVVYLNRCEYKSAQRVLEKAVALDPNDPRTQYHLGVVYLVLKRKDKFWQQHAVVKSLDSDLAQHLLQALNQENLLVVSSQTSPRHLADSKRKD